MPVGAGSIKRAAKKAADIETRTEVKEEPVVKAAEVITAPAEKKPVEKKPAAKKPAAPKKPAAKKAEEQDICNEAVHVTEEMPVWLL